MECLDSVAAAAAAAAFMIRHHVDEGLGFTESSSS
jgi:hypothetical protein